MNNVVLVGRLARDPEVRYGAESQAAFTRFSVAVDRGYVKEGEPSADFINCVAFGKTAEFIGKYFQKGKLIGLQGSIRTGSYTNKDGQKVYTTDVSVDRVEFVGSKAENSGNASVGGSSYTAPAMPVQQPQQAPQSSAIPAGFTALEDDEMPF